MPIRRRSFLSLIGASAAASFARSLKTVGAQLYTLRTVLPKQPLETLRALEQIGYREAELVAMDLDRTWPSFKQTSLKAVSLHLDTALFLKNQEKLPAALDDAAGRGLEYVVCPYIPPQERGGADTMRKLADTLNKAGEMCRKSGLKLAYHNHAFEWAASGEGTLLDVLLQAADPRLVSLELDIMWAQVAGVSPVSAIERYGSRVSLLHLKNVAPGIEKRYNEAVPRTAFREVGAGVIDIPAVLRAASTAGVRHYFVEQDQTPGDPIEALRKSYAYLEKLEY